MSVWYQIPLLIRTLLYSKPESGTGLKRWLYDLWLVVDAYVIMSCVFLL